MSAELPERVRSLKTHRPSTLPPQDSAATTNSKIEQTKLALYIATEYISQRRAGIGLVQQTESLTGNEVKRTQQRAWMLGPSSLVHHKIETEARLQMYAITGALMFAQATIERKLPEDGSLEKIVIFCESPKVVESVRYHLETLNDAEVGAENMSQKLLDNIRIMRSQTFANTGDRLKFQKIVAKAIQLRKVGVKAEIEMSAVRWKAQQTARTIAKQRPRGRKRRIRRTQKTFGGNQASIRGDPKPTEPMVREDELITEKRPCEPAQSIEISPTIAPLWTAILPLRLTASQTPSDTQDVRIREFSPENDEWILVNSGEPSEC